MNIDFLKSLETAVVKCEARNRQGRPGHPLVGALAARGANSDPLNPLIVVLLLLKELGKR